MKLLIYAGLFGTDPYFMKKCGDRREKECFQAFSAEAFTRTVGSRKQTTIPTATQTS